MGYEEEELLPFKEPTLDISDQKRIEMLVGMGYSRTEVEESLRLHKFDDTYASYLLLGRKSTDVSTYYYRATYSLLQPNFGQYLATFGYFGAKKIVLVIFVTYIQ